MLLGILRTLETLATELTLVRLERYMNPDVRDDVVSLVSRGSTRVPPASEAQVFGAPATNMAFTYMLLMGC